MQNAELVELSKVRSLTRSGAARSIRRAAGLSLGEVAEAVGVSDAAVSRWEAGLRSPRGPAALKYAELLSALLVAQPRGTRRERQEVASG